MLKAQELRDQSVEELEASYLDCQKELFHMINEMKQTKKIEKPHLIREKKRGIARLLTIIKEKKEKARG